jgi:DNA-damage-inducible protein J
MMADNAIIRARIDPVIKDEASIVLQAMGLTLSDAIRLMMVRIATDKTLPFSPLVPAPETIKALKEAREANLKRFSNLNDLMDDLRAAH